MKKILLTLLFLVMSATAHANPNTQPISTADVLGKSTEEQNLPLSSNSNTVKPHSLESDIGTTERFNFSVGIERMTGETTYQIGFPFTNAAGITATGHFPFSELKWPLDTWLFRADGRLTIFERLRVNASVKTSYSDPDDNMKDSDWLTLADPTQLDIYSESEISSFDALIFDTDLQYVAYRNPLVDVYGGAGYRVQKFDFQAKLLRQYSPSGLIGYDAIGDGRVAIDYSIDYKMPYLKAGIEFNIKDMVFIDGNFSWSPWLSVKDYDQHLLRENGGKFSRGSMDGDAYTATVAARWDITKHIFMKGDLNYTKMEADGKQHQVYGDGTVIGTVRETVDSKQFTTSLQVGYCF